MNILVATLGQSWQVIPEIAAVIAPHRCALYRNHPDAEIAEGRLAEGAELDAIWVIASGQAGAHCDYLRQWNAQLPRPFDLHIHVAQDTSVVSSHDEILHLRELIHRVLLHAGESGGKLWCSLAGGRKTMSADVQRAASLFGYSGLLHVVTQDPMAQ